MSVIKFEHVGIMVKDIEKSKGFYQEVVGLDLIDEMIHTNGELKLGFLGLNGEIIVELIEGYNDQLPVEGKVHHVAFTVKGIEEEKKRLKKLDIALQSEEITTLPNGAKYLFFHGPDGEWIEFFEPKN